MNKRNLLNILLALGLSFGAMTAVADINNLNVSDSFAYKTQKTVTVDIQVNTSGTNEQTGLIFFGQTAKGLRLLGSRSVNGTGHYTGKLVVPTYVKNIVVKSRWLNNFQELSATISNNKVEATIDNF